jgi:hypothetical protein
MEDLTGNEENGYPVPEPNKTMINVTNKPSEAHTHTHKKSLKEDIMEKNTE